MFSNPFARRHQNASNPSSFRVISVTRSTGVTGSPVPSIAQPVAIPSAIDCFHDADTRARERFGAHSEENPRGLLPARGVRPASRNVPTRWLTVFAGASDAAPPRYIQTARLLGRHLAAQGWGIMYGGTHGGQMGALADAALAGGGWVIGVLPGGGPTSWLQYPAAGEEGFLQTPTLEQRKADMLRPSRGAIALPGGWGTFDEVGYTMHATDKPLAFLNTDGFWDPILVQTLNMCDENFIAPNNMVIELRDPYAVTEAEAFIRPGDAEGDEGAA